MKGPKPYEYAMIAATAAACLLLLTGAEAEPGIYPERGGSREPPEWATPEGMDINLAPAEALAALPDIGETRAAAIIAYREEYGPIESEYELLAVPGLPANAALGAIEYISVEESYENTGS